MQKMDYQLWIDYHCGKLDNKKLTEKEYSEIRACEFAMHLLIPSEILLKCIGGEKNLKNILHNEKLLIKLANDFQVPILAMIFKIENMINENENKIKKETRNKKIKKRILKKRGNVIYLK